MNSIQYLLDENVDHVYQRALARREPSIVVWCVGEAGAPDLGTLDPEILA